MENLGAEAVIHQTDAGESARLDHGHRVQQRRYRRGGHGGADEPAVHGPDGGFYAAAHKGQHEHRQQQRHTAGIVCQMAAGHKLLGIVDDQEHHADEGQCRARDGVGGVFHARVDGLLGHGVHHQRDGGQRQQLIEQVHGHHVGGEGNAQRHTKGCGEEGPEHGLVSLMLHVIPCVHHGEGPQRGGQARKQLGGAVHAEGEVQRVGEPQEGKGAAVALQDGRPRQHSGQTDDDRVQCMPRPVGAEGEEVGCQTRHDGQEHRQAQ